MADFTTKAIKEAYKNLLEERSVSKITVKDVCEYCGIHKNTFYYHFEDLPHLLEEIMIAYADEFIAQYHDISTLNDCIDSLQSFIKSNIKVIRHLIDSGSYSEAFRKLLWKICEHVSDEYSELFVSKELLSEDNRELLKHSIKCELYGYAADWIYTGMNENRVYDLMKLHEVKKRVLDNISENYEKLQNSDHIDQQ